MLLQTPFHARTAALCTSYAWKEWAGCAAVCNYDRHSEREYFAVRHACGLIDVSPLYKYEVRGPDAGRLLARVTCKDATRMRKGQVTYTTWCDSQGKALDDGTISRFADDWFRITSSEPWLAWFRRHSRGLTVEVEDVTTKLGALALQGPTSRAVLDQLTDFDLDKMRFFRVRPMRLAGRQVRVSRTGYTGDLGFEIWVQPDDALHVWDAIFEAGRPYRLQPMGLDALDVLRIEAGFVLQGVDYISARSCVIEPRKSSPFEIGLGWTVELEREGEPFIGQKALLAERERGSEWALVGLDISWPELETLYFGYGLPPHLAPIACRDGVPVYARDGGQVGMVTSQVWSPLLKKYLALATVKAPYGADGTQLSVEHTVEFVRHRVTGTVVPKPFFDPERKKSVPGRKKQGAA